MMAELTTPIVFIVDDDVHLRREFDLSFSWDHCAPFRQGQMVLTEIPPQIGVF
jgi:hypothetical protein